MQIVGAIALGLTLFIGLPWLVLGNEFFLYQYFAPKRESVRRQVFEETRSFRQGTIQELSNMQREYIAGTPIQQTALRSLILRRSLEVPDDVLPADLRVFINQLRREQ